MQVCPDLGSSGFTQSSFLLLSRSQHYVGIHVIDNFLFRKSLVYSFSMSIIIILSQYGGYFIRIFSDLWMKDGVSVRTLLMTGSTEGDSKCGHIVM